jgi:endonuclease/exonuclease/phosphatase family metal-dependent hydrolase
MRARGIVWVAAAISTIVTSAAALTTSIPALPARATPRAPASVPVNAPFVLLQMNLCNSGMARSCYSFGKAVDEAVGKILQYRPDVVAVQEVCRSDLYVRGGLGLLAQAMAALYGEGQVGIDFQPARNRYTGDGYRCVNGEPYGIAVLYHGTGRDVYAGWYRDQDRSVEMRAWTCAIAIPGRLTTCTTHLSIRGAVALRQCQELMAILTSSWVTREVIVAGDFNLTSDIRQCPAPSGYEQRDDGSLQHVFFTGTTIEWLDSTHERMQWTDHPLLVERFRI